MYNIRVSNILENWTLIKENNKKFNVEDDYATVYTVNIAHSWAFS